jgi:hypothetical protein
MSSIATATNEEATKARTFVGGARHFAGRGSTGGPPYATRRACRYFNERASGGQRFCKIRASFCRLSACCKESKRGSHCPSPYKNPPACCRGHGSAVGSSNRGSKQKALTRRGTPARLASLGRAGARHPASDSPCAEAASMATKLANLMGCQLKQGPLQPP